MTSAVLDLQFSKNSPYFRGFGKDYEVIKKTTLKYQTQLSTMFSLSLLSLTHSL
jgi:hypothetical protein